MHNDNPDLRKCPSCRNGAAYSAIFCPRCGHFFGFGIRFIAEVFALGLAIGFGAAVFGAILGGIVIVLFRH
jgi:hypothetical protein